MKSPDIILAALAYTGVFTIEQGQELSNFYHRKADYDAPVPVNFAAALDLVVPLFEEIDDDRAVSHMLGRGEVVGNCDDCGQPIDAHGNVVDTVGNRRDDDDGVMSDEDIEGATALWFGMKAIFESISR